jgi:hypothetical protein
MKNINYKMDKRLYSQLWLPINRQIDSQLWDLIRFQLWLQLYLQLDSQQKNNI